MVKTKRAAKGLREVAAEIGNISPSTLSRVENGRIPDMETFLELCDWLGVAPATFFAANDVSAADKTPLEAAEAIELQLRADKNLDPVTANTIATMVRAAYQELSLSQTRPGDEEQNPSGFGPVKLSREFRQRCEKIAADQRNLLELAPHDPLRGEALAERHEVTLCEPRDLPGATRETAANLISRTDWDAVLLPALPNHGPIILLRPGVSPGRRQSTLMHEMAHLLLLHEPIRWSASVGRLEAPRAADEAEARYLGGCLQIPRVGLTWALQTGLTIARTASHFGASEDMVRYRANVTGVRLPR